MVEGVLNIIRKLVEPDVVYLLGREYERTRLESIFCTGGGEKERVTSYYLLVLLGNLIGMPPHVWQERIEQACREMVSVTTIVLETTRFNDWLGKGQLFAVKTNECAKVVYRAPGVKLCEAADGCVGRVGREEWIRKRMGHARAFAAGAELYRLRMQYGMAAFMLHQSAEQALHTIIKAGAGYHTHTHNLERLLRYAAMAAPEVNDVFLRDTEKELHLFGCYRGRTRTAATARIIK